MNYRNFTADIPYEATIKDLLFNATDLYDILNFIRKRYKNSETAKLVQDAYNNHPVYKGFVAQGEETVKAYYQTKYNMIEAFICGLNNEAIITEDTALKLFAKLDVAFTEYNRFN